MEKHTILTAPVSKKTQRLVHEQAKKHNVPIRVLCALLIEHGLEDIAKGRLEVTKPAIAISNPA